MRSRAEAPAAGGIRLANGGDFRSALRRLRLGCFFAALGQRGRVAGQGQLQQVAGRKRSVAADHHHVAEDFFQRSRLLPGSWLRDRRRRRAGTSADRQRPQTGPHGSPWIRPGPGPGHGPAARCPAVPQARLRCRPGRTRTSRSARGSHPRGSPTSVRRRPAAGGWIRPCPGSRQRRAWSSPRLQGGAPGPAWLRCAAHRGPRSLPRRAGRRRRTGRCAGPAPAPAASAVSVLLLGHVPGFRPVFPAASKCHRLVLFPSVVPGTLNPGCSGLGRCCAESAGGAESAGPADRVGELSNGFELRGLDALDHHLRNPVSALEPNGFGGVRV